ncbi:16S rRNA (guanine(527)-N(7))-methyltransferase RsmG [Pseudooceanicola aestuarii]|uniref:16S rRNA (guanine(527)-N(7))-methyltransferase RsmG n=1 Tax=Pseudooceanicola aestuarii TaxID=2697319 RepID=UPI0013D225B9|nr:16S rRNA (guanine(527)-N(7))-methyltransferase RsmG [Pseudooceanicola aestuarii]
MNRENVSRETYGALETYAALLKKWNPRINLVAKSTVADLWTRHMSDSLQVADIAPKCQHWVDLGSGGGFPGLPVALLARDRGTPKRVTLVESDTRKATFLRTVIRDTNAPADVLAERIESIPPLMAEVLSARALAPLSRLLEFADLHLAPRGIALFSKGVTWKDEVSRAQEQWRFDWEAIRSKTDPDAVILKIEGVHPCQTS